MKNLFKTIVTLLVGAALLIPTVLAASQPAQPAAAGGFDRTADTREEVVYANLTPSGSVKDVYVVNLLHLDAAGDIVDYGRYTSLKNLTNTSPLTRSGDVVRVDAPAGDFYYQGTPENAELPWLLNMTYTLDGQEVSPDALAGQSGAFELRLSAAPNPDAGTTYADNYLLQVSVTLDGKTCRNITAPDSTLANAGGDKRISFTVLPGDTGELTVSADVTDFSMQGIEFAALPMSLGIDAPDTDALTGDLSSLSDAVRALNDGVKELHDGVGELKSGADDLKSGSASFNSGLRSLSGSSSGLVSGSGEILNALSALSSSLSGSSGELNLTALAELPGALEQLAAALSETSSALTDVDDAFSASYAALDAAIAEIPDTEISQAALATLYQNNPGQAATLDQLSAYYAAAAEVKATYAAVKAGFDAVGSALGQSTGAINTIAASLTDMASQLRAAQSEDAAMTGMLELSGGLQALSANYEGFHDGLVAYTSGVTSLSGNYNRLNSGVSGLAGGIGDVYDGIGDLYDGTTELNDATQDIPNDVDEQINDLLGDYDKSDYTPSSFVSPKNLHTVSVQFVFKTDKIEKTAAPAAAPEEQAPENIWTRFLALFQ